MKAPASSFVVLDTAGLPVPRLLRIGLPGMERTEEKRSPRSSQLAALLFDESDFHASPAVILHIVS